VQLLDELAQLGMEMARRQVERMKVYDEAAVCGEIAPLSPADASRAANNFARIARAVRLTLLLKAKVRGELSGSPGALVKSCARDAGRPETLDTEVLSAELTESEPLREPSDPRTDRDRETPDAPPGADFGEVVQRIARDLGVEVIRTGPAGSTAGAHDWVIIRPDDPPIEAQWMHAAAAPPRSGPPDALSRNARPAGGYLPRGQAP
jgi:hypothetical protein